ncbi:MAG: hypothetical protein ACI4V5_08110 [Prevotella sp.]
MTNRLKRIFVWLGRIDKCRGFGIQSPWAYAMATNVINNHSRADVYDVLGRKFHNAGVINRRLCELMYRLADELQPSVIVNIDSEHIMSGVYLQAGCPTSRYEVINEDSPDLNAGSVLSQEKALILCHIKGCHDIAHDVTLLSEYVNDGSAIMIEGINDNKKNRDAWADIVENMPNVVTFDLYYCGLIFFDKKRYKQNYIINF